MLTPSKGGADPNPPTKFNDNNGFLDYRRGDDPTWAEVWGKISDNDTALTDSVSAWISDNKEWSGVITETDDGFWKIKLDAKMDVGASTHAEANYGGPLHATARGVLCAWGDISGVEAVEVSSELGANRNDYDIDEDINGLPVTIADGGHKYRAGSPLITIDVSETIAFSTVWHVVVQNLIAKFTYESRAVADMLVTLTGNGGTFAKADARHGIPYGGHEWEGEAEAWEINSAGNNKLIKKFTLD